MDGSTHPRSKPKVTELLTSACPYTAGVWGFDGPTEDDHTTLSVTEYGLGPWFTIITEDGCVSINESTFEMMAKDGLRWLERRKVAASKARAAA